MRKILIVVDMQNDFVTGSLGTPEARAIVPRVLKKIMKCIDGGYYVYFTHDTHFDDPDDKDNYVDSLEGKYLPIKHCIENTDGWEIINELKDLESICTIITKYTFGYDEWDRRIQDLIIEEVYNGDESKYFWDAGPLGWGGDPDEYFQFELIGLCTDICVVSNALILRAQFPNSEIIVHADCCAGTTPEKHAAALEVMKSCQILVEGE